MYCLLALLLYSWTQHTHSINVQHITVSDLPTWSTVEYRFKINYNYSNPYLYKRIKSDQKINIKEIYIQNDDSVVWTTMNHVKQR